MRRHEDMARGTKEQRHDSSNRHASHTTPRSISSSGPRKMAWHQRGRRTTSTTPQQRHRGSNHRQQQTARGGLKPAMQVQDARVRGAVDGTTTPRCTAAMPVAEATWRCRGRKLRH